MLKRKWTMFAAILGVILIGGVLIGPVMSDVETPKYEIVQINQKLDQQAEGRAKQKAEQYTEDNVKILFEETIEVRRYQPMVVAEVEVLGQREDAISEGFRLLAKYIFGNNTVHQDIAMTAPVQQQINQKIAMTAPVQQQMSQTVAMTAPVQQQQSGQSWIIRFVMPAQYSIKSLPKPVDQRVTLREIVPKQFVVIRFTGTNSEDNIKQHEKYLLDYIQKNKLAVIGSPIYAFYNPPWTLPPMRRNEVMFELAPSAEPY